MFADRLTIALRASMLCWRAARGSPAPAPDLDLRVGAMATPTSSATSRPLTLENLRDGHRRRRVRGVWSP
jgi:hypothetical protein